MKAINKIARWAKKILKNVTGTEDAITQFTTAKTHSELDSFEILLTKNITTRQKLGAAIS